MAHGSAHLDALVDPQQLAFSVSVGARAKVDPKGRYSTGGHRDPQVAISDALCVGAGVAGDAPSQRRKPVVDLTIRETELLL
jgi:hypothetical protein